MNSELAGVIPRSEEHTSELQSHVNLVCRLLLEKKKTSSLNTNFRRCCTKKTKPWSICVIHVFSGESCKPFSRRNCSTRGRTSFFFFFNDTATTEIYTLSLHDALPI